MKLEGKNIIITGASSGIGYLLADKLRKYTNTKIVCVARNTGSIPQKWENVSTIDADLTKPEEVDHLFYFANKIFNNQIDIFIANAGIAYIEEFRKADWEHIEYIHKLNVSSPIYSLQKLIENNSDKPCQFACTISGAGLAAIPYYSLYCSSKASLHHFIETFRYEKPENLSITAIYPVATQTQFFDKASEQEGFPLPFPQQKPESVVNKMIKAIEKDKKRVYPSMLFRIFYPIGRAFPFLFGIYSLLEKSKLKRFFA